MLVNEQAIHDLLNSLEERDDGAWGDLPAKFLGIPLSLKIGPVGQVEEILVQLAGEVLPDLEKIVASVEVGYREYFEEVGETAPIPFRPRIWINEDSLIDDGPKRWALVVEVEKNPDFGIHIEFDGPELLEVWSGD